MRILLYSISFSPEVAGSGRFNGEMANWLSQRGHKVDVITAFPYYPEWNVRKEYKGKGWFIQKKPNLNVYRTPIYVPKVVTGKSRIIHELSFTINSFYHWCSLFLNKYNVVIAVCPPLQAGLLPLLFCKITNTPFLFHIQDLQVDAARELGMIKNRWLLNILDKVEQYILQRADCVSSISEGMRSKIFQKGVDSSNYFMLQNWVLTSSIKPLSKQDSLKKDMGFLESDKIALYAGSIGEKQGLEILIEVADLLKSNTDIKILVFGEGASKQKLVEKAQLRKLKNLLFFPSWEEKQTAKLLSMADIHLVIQKQVASDLVMPSKLANILSVGGVSIVSAEKHTTLAKIVEDNAIGWSVIPENGDMLAQVIREKIMSPYLPLYSQNARAYAVEHLDKDSILSKFEEFLHLSFA